MARTQAKAHSAPLSKTALTTVPVKPASKPKTSLISKLAGSYKILLAMLLFMFMQPLADSYADGRLFFNIMVSMVILLGMTCVHTNTKHRAIALAFAIPTVVTRWLEYGYLATPSVVLFGNILAATFIGITSLFTLDHILKTKDVTSDTLAAAVSVYLMVGMTFALTYFVIDLIHPNSFSMPAGGTPAIIAHDARTYYYLSFVTLTTVGFGDTVPLSPIARSFTLLEAIFGQLFLAILIASLVGRRLANVFGK